MTMSQKQIPIVEFGESKFVPAVLPLKTRFKPTTRRHERYPADTTRCDPFAGESKILRAGSEGGSPFGTLVPILPATPATFADETAQKPRFVNLKCSRGNEDKSKQ